jgi:hypothetical protein
MADYKTSCYEINTSTFWMKTDRSASINIFRQYILPRASIMLIVGWFTNNQRTWSRRASDSQRSDGMHWASEQQILLVSCAAPLLHNAMVVSAEWSRAAGPIVRGLMGECHVDSLLYRGSGCLPCVRMHFFSVAISLPCRQVLRRRVSWTKYYYYWELYVL